jgi:hypothetical protein
MPSGEGTGKSVWMTDEQFFQLLKELGVTGVQKPAGGKITLVLSAKHLPGELTATEMKAHSQDAVRELEEKRQDTRENRFAEPLTKEIDLGGEKTSEVQYLKRDDQLSAEERETKKRLLGEIEAEIAYHRLIIAGMNHLQVNFKELQERLPGVREQCGTQARPAGRTGERICWTKGIKSAALFCIKESKKPENAGRSEKDLCREFLASYTLEDDEDYDADQLYRNIQQIKLLDATD